MPTGHYGRLRPKKSLGQNFLRDENICRKIIGAIKPGERDVIVEIGPGEGALTKYLAPRVARLILVEIDDRVVARMRREYDQPNVEVLHRDILEMQLDPFAGAGDRKLRIVGNIPYNITSPILLHLLEQRAWTSDVTLMMQREVAKRLVAEPSTKDYGILSVSFQLYFDVLLLFDVSPNAFHPKPKVTSSVVRLVPLEKPRYVVADEQFFREMVRATFGKRRKTLRNSLSYFIDEVPELPPRFDLQRRPESLSVKDLVELANALASRLKPTTH